MEYKIEFEKAAEKFIKKQNPKVQQKLISLIEQLPVGSDIKKLKGYENYYRLRVGDIKVININNRGDVYKQL